MSRFNQLTRLLIMLCIQLLQTLYAFVCVYVYFTFVYMRIYIYICVCVCILVVVAVDPSLTSTKGRLRNVTDCRNITSGYPRISS